MIRKIIVSAGIVLCVSCVFISCKKKEVTVPKFSTVTGTEYQVTRGEVRWSGFLTREDKEINHFGNLKIQEGKILLQAGLPQRAEFIADMGSLLDDDLEEKPVQKQQLEIFLKSPSMFETQKYKTSLLTITSAKRMNSGDYNTLLTGDLTVMAITKPIEFYANVFVENDTLSIFSKPTYLNRRIFGLKFQLPSTRGKIKSEISLQLILKAALTK